MEQVIIEQKDQSSTTKPPILPLPNVADTQDIPKEGWHEERLIDDGGEKIFIRYEGQPSVERYEFIRDFLSFKIGRLTKAKKTEPTESDGADD